MAKLINGNGNLAIYAEEDADWYASIFGNQTSITGIGNQFAYSLLDANTIGVEDGVIITKEGRRIQLNANEIDEFEIPNGSQGTTNYYIIGYRLITDETSAQTCETFVELMDNGTDTIPEGSFREGDDSVDVSLYRVKQEDLTITAVTLLLPKVGAMSAMANDIATLNTNLTDLKGVLLWTNPNPSSDFAPQTILNAATISQYSYLEITFLTSKGSIGSVSTLNCKLYVDDVKGVASYASGYSTNKISTFSRSFGINSSGLEFMNAGSGEDNFWNATSNNVLIPYKVRGFK